MKKPIVVVTSHFIKPVDARIESDYEVRRKGDGTLFTRDELLAAAEGADAILITPFDRLDAEFFSRLSPSVKVISTNSVGVDHIDMAAAVERNVAIGYTPAEVTDATADIAMLLLLGASRRAFEAQDLIRRGEWTIPRAQALLGWQLTGKILGILGMGRIGLAVAKRATGFGMHAIIVNTARGGLVEDDDLIEALKSGRVAAAGLDVYEGEPKLNPGYVELRNTFLLPHIGTATIESRTNMGMVALDNIDAVLNGTSAPSLA
jgi:lactate dehydrogenase-like 2-hydroxyacid dehydrogenase